MSLCFMNIQNLDFYKVFKQKSLFYFKIHPFLGALRPLRASVLEGSVQFSEGSVQFESHSVTLDSIEVQIRWDNQISFNG